jgi:hypothetical protein
MVWLVFWGLNSSTPNVVYDPLTDELESIFVSKNFYGGRSSERVSKHCYLLKVEALFPSLPVDTF